MITTTLSRIYDCSPCPHAWLRGLEAAGKTEPDDEPISYEAILDAVGLKDALWCCRAELQYDHLWRRYAIWCARHVQHLMTDPRSIAALDVAERHANGEATDQELDIAERAARAASDTVARAAMASWAASDATRAATRAAWATWVAASAAATAARAAARAASEDVGYYISYTVDIASEAAQSAAFRQLVTTGTLPPVPPMQEVIQ